MPDQKKGKPKTLSLIISLLLCGLVATEWVRSRQHTDIVAYFTPAAKLQAIAADSRGVTIFFSGISFVERRGFSLTGISVASDSCAGVRDLLVDPASTTVHKRFGFIATSGTLPLTASLAPSFGAVILPYWFVLTLALLPCLAILRHWLRQRRRMRRGECLICGYDMRASGNVCPECGAERSVKPTNTSNAAPAAP